MALRQQILKVKAIKITEEQRGLDGEIGSMLCVTQGLSERREENVNATQRLKLRKDKSSMKGVEKVFNNSK